MSTLFTSYIHLSNSDCVIKTAKNAVKFHAYDCHIRENGDSLSLDGVDPNIKYLKFHKNSTLKHLPSQIFDHFTNLKEFVADNVNLEVIPVGSLENAGNLKFLSLNRNIIKSLVEGNFNNANKLEVIWLAQNNISEISSLAFVNLENLKEIKLSGNLLRELPAEVFYPLKNLEVVNIESNDLENLNKKTFLKNEKIKTIKLFKNNLLEFNIQVAHDSLCFINVDNNSINHFQLHIHHVHRLTEESEDCTINAIHASNNRIAQFSVTDGFIVPTLYLDNNQLTDLSTLTTLNGLRKFYISSNPLTLQSLRDLHKIGGLRTIGLRNLSLNSFDPDLFVKFGDVEELNLSENKFKDLNVVPLYEPLPNLIKLAVADNPLHNIDVDKLLQKFPNLIQIDIRGTLIKCDRLEAIVQDFGEKNISLVIPAKPLDSDEDNINGITCF